MEKIPKRKTRTSERTGLKIKMEKANYIISEIYKIPAKVISIERVDNIKKNRFIEIGIQRTDNNIIAHHIFIKLPDNDEINSNSHLAKWKNYFGEYPYINQKVFLIMTNNYHLAIPFNTLQRKELGQLGLWKKNRA
jgi:hypothetical protein